MSPGRIIRTASPPESAVARWYSGADLLDSYAVRLAHGDRPDMRTIAEQTFQNPPAWFRFLLGVRDRIVAVLSVKTSTELRDRAAADDRVTFFRVLSVTDNEIILGDDDRHLDFRASLLRRCRDDGDEIVATTVVRCHNLFGKAYIATIRPFHLLAARSSLARLAAARTR